MTPAEAAAAIGRPIGSIGSRFMFDPDTYAGAAAHGYAGLDFYFAGRCGVLGDVDADIVNAALGFFEPASVRSLWEQGCAVAGAATAADRFGEACANWGRAHFDDGVDLVRLNELAATAIAAAPAVLLPLFAGWRHRPVADDPAGAACQRLNVLRELRGGAHLVAVVAAGVSPFEAVLAKGGPANADLFGHTGPYPDVAHLADRMAEIEARTDDLVAPALAALDDTDRTHLVELVREVRAGLH